MVNEIFLGLSLLILLTSTSLFSLLLEEDKIFEVSAQEPVTLSGNLLTYHNDSLGISIQYPSNWLKTDVADGIIFQSPLENNLDAFQEQVGVSVSTISAADNASSTVN